MDWKLALQRVNNFVERGQVLREKEYPFDERTHGEYTAWRTGVHEFLGQIDGQEGSTWQWRFNEAFMKPSKVSRGAPDYAFMTRRHRKIMADAIGVLAGVGEFVANKQVEELAERGRELAVEMPQASERRKHITDREITEFLRTEFNYSRRKIGKRLNRICGDNEKLRQILLRDISDAGKCFAHKVWKPVVVLCGGAMEGMLSVLVGAKSKTEIENAFARAYQNRNPKDLQQYSLENYVDVAEELGILAKGSAKLSQGVRNYRNYVHPTEELKVGHPIGQNDARIALALVFKILEEIGK